MKQPKNGSRNQGPPSFDLLRARVESNVRRPGVVVVTSALSGDGKTAASHGLAASLGAIGYRTLLVDAGVRWDTIAWPARAASIEEMLIESATESAIPRLRIVALTNPALARESSLPSVENALAAARGCYDYVVVDAGCALENALASHFVSSADAVLVVVRAGRRRRTDDERLARSLERLDAQFFGVVAISPSIVDSASTIVRVRSSETGHSLPPDRFEREPMLRSVRPHGES
jgi:Mrp family chromosome partitioning ATPase